MATFPCSHKATIFSPLFIHQSITDIRTSEILDCNKQDLSDLRSLLRMNMVRSRQWKNPTPMLSPSYFNSFFYFLIKLFLVFFSYFNLFIFFSRLKTNTQYNHQTVAPEKTVRIRKLFCFSQSQKKKSRTFESTLCRC